MCGPLFHNPARTGNLDAVTVVMSAIRVARSDAPFYRIPLGAVQITGWGKARAARERLWQEVFAVIKARADIGQ